MKYLPILLFISCSLGVENLPPKVEITCPHTLELTRLEWVDVTIVSDLPQVTILKGWGENQVAITVNDEYYDCIFLSLPDDETSITIIAEQRCEYIF